MMNEYVQEDYQSGQYTTASQVQSQKEYETLLKILLESEDLISLIDHEFRGEVLIIKRDEKTGELFEVWETKRKPIINNNSAIEDIIRILRFMGLNKVSLLTNIDDRVLNNKLRDFEHRLADLFFLKRKDWNMVKEEMPINYSMIVSIVEDAIYRAKDGGLLKVMRSNFQMQEYKDTSAKPGILSQLPGTNKIFKQ